VDLRRLLAIVRKWFPMFIAGVLLAAGAAFAFSALQAKTYEAKATLIVGQALTSANPDYTGLLASQQLTSTYASIATTRPLLEAVIERLGLETTTDGLLKRISTETSAGSPLLIIAAQGTDPEQAAAIANALGDALIAETAALQGRQEDVQASIDADLEATQAQIATTQDRVAELLAIDERTPEQDTELGTLEGRLVSLRATYATLLSYASAGATNLLTVVEPAVAPADAISPKTLLNVLVAAVLGLLIAVGVAALAEYLNDAVTSAEDVEASSGLSTLGSIGQMKGVDGRADFHELMAQLHPRSSITEGYRTLRTNLEFTAVNAPVRSLLVTSARAGEGKTVTAANLAIVYAQAGRRVLLVDADLRKPRLHLAFGFANSVGLTSALIADRGRIAGIEHASAQPDLSVMSSGQLPPNPAELLSSPRMRAFLEEAQATHDLVILDSPPLQAFSDAAILSSLVDRTLLVVAANRSRRRALKQARGILARAGANVAGVVINRTAGPEYADYTAQYGAYFSGDSAPTAAGAGDTGGTSGT
jgi:polysaccharide biosynthesis transport protein